MFNETHGIRSIRMAVAAVMWGIVPFTAQAISPPQHDVVFMTSPDAGGCGPVVAGNPFTIAAEPRAETVKAVPFSGVGTTEVVTTLADGNRIVRTNTMRYYRDSQGRTRTEYSLAAIGPFTPEQAQTVVTITDPVEGKRYVLHSALKRADIFPLGGAGNMVAGAGAANAHKGGEPGAFVMGSFSSGPATAAAPSAGVSGPGLAARGVGSAPAAASTRSLGVSSGAPGAPSVGVSSRAAKVGVGTMVAPRGAGSRPVAPPVVVMSSAAALPPANAGFIMQYSPTVAMTQEGCRPNAKPLPSPTSMGERVIEGLKVAGTRNEFTIAAGAVGNEQPIIVSSEQWFSPELGVVVSSTHRDPMMGDTSYKLEQISRAEPDPSLFTVPADYTQTDMQGQGFVFETAVAPPSRPGAAR